MNKVTFKKDSEKEMLFARLEEGIQSLDNVNYLIEGETFLHKAALYGSVKICRMLLEKDALVNINNQSNQTPLHIAALNNHKKVVELLLEHGGIVVLLEEADVKTFYATVKDDIKVMIMQAEGLHIGHGDADLSSEENDEDEENSERTKSGCCTLM